jgi:hypothetical protein
MMMNNKLEQIEFLIYLMKEFSEREFDKAQEYAKGLTRDYKIISFDEFCALIA